MKVEISEMTDIAVDWVVAKLEWDTPVIGPHRTVENALQVTVGQRVVYSPSHNWSQGGLIIEREVICYEKSLGKFWTWLNSDPEGDRNPRASGPTLLIAAMRCYVQSKLGEEIEIPDELLGENQ